MEVGEEVEEGEVPTGMGRTVTFSGGGRSSDGGGFERGGGGGQSSEGGGFERGGGGRKERRKGRGFDATKDTPADRYEGRGGIFDRLGDPRATETDAGPAKSVEGWIIFVSNVHKEAGEEDIMDKFSDFGEVKNIHLNLDRALGFVKGYALLEFQEHEQAKRAVKEMNGQELMGQRLVVDFAFSKKPLGR